MNNNELQQEIQELCNDEQFTSRISMCTTAAEIADLFTAEGVAISADEMEQLLAMVAVPAGDELDEDALDGVSGGAMLPGRLGLILLPLLPRLPITLPVVPVRKVTK